MIFAGNGPSLLASIRQRLKNWSTTGDVGTWGVYVVGCGHQKKPNTVLSYRLLTVSGAPRPWGRYSKWYAT
jgi:hypothetical protein